MRTRRHLRLLGGLAAVAVLLVACGGGEEFESGTGNGDETDTEGDGEETDTEGEDEQAAGDVCDATSDYEAAEVEAVKPLSGVDLSGNTYTVGSKNFTEQLVLGQIAIEALEAAGAETEDQTNLAGTDAARQGVLGGEIDLYWGYNGTAWITFFGCPGDELPENLYGAVHDVDLEQNDTWWFAPAPFNNTYALAYRTEAAEELGNPETLSDYAELVESNPEQASLCTEVEFASRDDGLPGMAEAYGFDPAAIDVATLDVGAVYTAIDTGNPCNFGEIFESDGRVAALDLTILEDDQDFFPPYNPSVMMNNELAQEDLEALQQVFNPVANSLDLETMQELNARVDEGGEDPNAVAADWLTQEGFLE